MGTWLGRVLFSFVGVILLTTGSSRLLGADSTTAKPKYPTESTWISSAIATNIADLLHFAKARDKSPLQISTTLSNDVRQLEISWHKPGLVGSFFTERLTAPIDSFIWSPELYQSFAEAMVKADAISLPPTESIPPATTRIFETLLNPQVDVVEKENQRLSEWLTREPLNPSAHEEAALLCGVMALREAAGCFYDARPALNQLTAHLAIARLIRKNTPSSDAGVAANIVLEVIAGRQVSVDELLKNWQASVMDDPVKLPWVKALRLRNTGNWTAIKTPGSEPLLVRLEYLRATAFQVNNHMAMEFWKQDGTLRKMPDMPRIGMSFGCSVGEGHIFSRITFALEIEDIKKLMAARNQTFLPGKLAEFVNVDPGTPILSEPGKNPQLSVITPGAWGHFYQRHLLHEALAIHYFINHMWGVPERAVEFKNALTPMIGQFNFFPIVAYRWAAPDEALRLLPSLRQFTARNLERIADYNLITIAKADAELNTLITPWYTPFEPPGTTYAAEYRSYSGKYFDEVESYYVLRPLSPNIAWGHFRNVSRKERVSLDSAKACYGSLLDSNLWAIRTVANALNDSPDGDALFEKLCQLDTDSYIRLGDRLVARNLSEQAAAAYQKAVDQANDHVMVANNCEWLVNYYYDKGEKDKALKVAEFAAEVYSFSGLETMMNLQEKMGNLAAAESYGYKILDRYENSSPLSGFFGRHPEAPGYAEFLKKLAEQVAKIFPGGVMTKVTLDSFKTPPTDGIMLGPSARLRSFGIEADTVIVAVDGIQVRNEAQYIHVRGLSPSPKMDVIVWKRDHYEAITLEQKGRRFNVNIIDYRR